METVSGGFEGGIEMTRDRNLAITEQKLVSICRMDAETNFSLASTCIFFHCALTFTSLR
jgi:hypothetical protein